jgi:hypothetical protein
MTSCTLSSEVQTTSEPDAPGSSNLAAMYLQYGIVTHGLLDPKQYVTMRHTSARQYVYATVNMDARYASILDGYLHRCIDAACYENSSPQRTAA